MTDFGTDDARLDQRLSLLWDKLTRNSRETAALKPTVRTFEKRLDRLEESVAQLRTEMNTLNPKDQP